MKGLAKLASFLTDWSERWVPSAFSIAALLTLIVFIAGIFLGGASFIECLRHWGNGFWLLLEFGMQMCLIMVTGYIVAVSPPVRRLLNFITALFKTPKGAIAGLALLSMLLSWVNWGLGIVGAAVLARLFARRIPELDLRLIVAVAYLGLGCTWHAGLSASGPLLIATPGHFLEQEIGVIPVAQTLFHPFNLGLTLVVLVTVTLFVTQLVRRGDVVEFEQQRHRFEHFEESAGPSEEQPRLSLAQFLDRGYGLNGLLGIGGLLWLAATWTDGQLRVSINSVNFFFLFLGILLHPSPQSVVRASAEAAQFVHGIILQFPFYSGMFGIIQGTGMSEAIGRWFVSVASTKTLPLIVYWYSGFVNYFVPSGGSKWAIEAPYLVEAARALDVPINKIAMAYAWGDMATDLLQPFWAIPLITATGLEFREILGYEMVIFLFYFPLVSLAFFWFM